MHQNCAVATNYGANAKAQEKDSWTPLRLAAINGHVEVAQILLEHKADIKAQTRWGSTLFHVASANGHLDFVRLLLGQHSVDVNVRDHRNFTPLHRASDTGR
jgi:ankyrin repeat protein